MRKNHILSTFILSVVLFNTSFIMVMADNSNDNYFEINYFDDLSRVLIEYKNNSEQIAYILPQEVIDNTKYSELMKSSPLFEYAFNQLGKPYVFSSSGPDNFDCSGFTYYVFKQTGVTIPRSSEQQSKSGVVVDISNLIPGDLVFFDTRNITDSFNITDSYDDQAQYMDILFNDEISKLRPQNNEKKSFVPEKVTHVGMFIGDNKFIHASSGKEKVIISDLASGYYKARFVISKRYL